MLGSDNATGIRYLVDPRIVAGTAWITGADSSGNHVIHLTAGRDFTPDGVIEAAEILEGDTCPACGSEVEIARGIEIGHIFQLGRKYAEALDLWVQGEDGKPVTPTMGSYGVGVSRCLAAIAEATCDDIGLCWPREIAPADVHLVMAGKEGGPHREAAERLAADLEARGLRVLFDDRVKVSPGVRFKDAELIGVPTIAVVGRGIDADEPTIEVKDRKSGDRSDVALADVGRSPRHRLHHLTPHPHPHLVIFSSAPCAKRSRERRRAGWPGARDQEWRSRPWSMTRRSVSPSPALVVNTASSAPVAHIRIVSDSPGNTGDAKRPSMCWNFAGSLSHTAWSSARPVKP